MYPWEQAAVSPRALSHPASSQAVLCWPSDSTHPSQQTASFQDTTCAYSPVPMPCRASAASFALASRRPAAVAAADAAAAPVKGDLLNASYYPSRADAANVTKRWYIIDAKGQTLGRLATLAATFIRWAGQ